MEVCIKIEPIPGESPKMFGRHFDETDMLVSKVRFKKIYIHLYFVLSAQDLNFKRDKDKECLLSRGDHLLDVLLHT